MLNSAIIKQQVADGYHVVVYGVGSSARKFMFSHEWLYPLIHCFVTTEGSSAGFYGKKVLALKSLDIPLNKTIFLVASQFYQEIFDNLCGLGVDKKNIVDLDGPELFPREKLQIYEELYTDDSLKNKRFYNIGAGSFYHPMWTNVDFFSDWYAVNKEQISSGIQYDLLSLQPLPIENSSAEVIYTSHTIEHITDQAAQNVFNESYRVLKTGGIFRATTPNIDLEYRAYKDNDRNYFYWIEHYSIEKNWRRAKYNQPLNSASIAQVFLAHFASSVSTLHSDGSAYRIDDTELATLFATLPYEDALNFCTSKCELEVQKRNPGNHINWWNFSKLSTMLRAAGFKHIYLSAYGQSHCPVLRDLALFDNTHPKISLYVEAVK